MNGYMLAGTITGVLVGLVIAAVGMTLTKRNRKEPQKAV